MNSIYLLIPLSIVLIGLGIWAFFWAVNTGQFDDLDDPARRILEGDDDTPDPGA
ncbi:MAG: cbb3-type cytochrome oxidase assembly protein CcoS [Steroidobacteraceae bacterium]